MIWEKSLENIIPLVPVHFFGFQMDCLYAKGDQLEQKHLLPNLSSFHGESSFATVSMGWQEKRILIQIMIEGSFDAPAFPKWMDADSIELFFDTRDVKTTSSTTRFCHHFFFLPDPIRVNGEEIQAGEVTRFRNEDAHPLCDPSLLQIHSLPKKRKRLFQIFIPSECLHGYDPLSFDRLGFSYRINHGDAKQHFSANGGDFTIENHPFFWASFKLIK